MLGILISLDVVLGVAAVISLLGVLSLSRRFANLERDGQAPRPRRPAMPSAGDRIGPFDMTLMDGSPFSSASLAGARITVMFSMQGCAPCGEALDEIARDPSLLAGPCYVLIASTDDSYAREVAARLPAAASAGRIALQGDVTNAFGVNGFPAVLVVHDGVVEFVTQRLSALPRTTAP